LEHSIEQHYCYKQCPIFVKCSYDNCDCFINGTEKYCDEHKNIEKNDAYWMKYIGNPMILDRNIQRTKNPSPNENKINKKNMLKIIRQQLYYDTKINIKMHEKGYHVPPTSPCEC
jgi:hypothetical protein